MEEFIVIEHTKTKEKSVYQFVDEHYELCYNYGGYIVIDGNRYYIKSSNNEDLNHIDPEMFDNLNFWFSQYKKLDVQDFKKGFINIFPSIFVMDDLYTIRDIYGMFPNIITDIDFQIINNHMYNSYRSQQIYIPAPAEYRITIKNEYTVIEAHCYPDPKGYHILFSMATIGDVFERFL